MMTEEAKPLDFRQLGNLASAVTGKTKTRIWAGIADDESIYINSAVSPKQWDCGILLIPDKVEEEKLCRCMFAAGEDDWPESEDTFKSIKRSIGRMKLTHLGEEAMAILEKPYDIDNNSSWMLCLELTKRAIKSTNAAIEHKRAKFGKDARGALMPTGRISGQPSSSKISTTPNARKRGKTRRDSGVAVAPSSQERKLGALFAQELENYRASLAEKAESVLSLFETSTTIDVSQWPEKPYKVEQTVRQTKTGAGSVLLCETPQFQDMLKAASFKYTSIAIYDEQGTLIVSIDDLPHYKDFEPPRTSSYPSPKGWKTQCRLTEETLDDSEESIIPVLWYTTVHKESGISISLRNWKPHDSHCQWSTPWLPKPLKKRDKHDLYYTASLEIKDSHKRELSIEVSCTYDAMSISENKFFRDLVFEPSIKVAITKAEENEAYDFILHQYSSQSPFWRRTDGRHYIEQLAVEPFSPHLLWWKYDNQWLMLGEGYAIVVDAQKKGKR